MYKKNRYLRDTSTRRWGLKTRRLLALTFFVLAALVGYTAYTHLLPTSTWLASKAENSNAVRKTATTSPAATPTEKTGHTGGPAALTWPPEDLDLNALTQGLPGQRQTAQGDEGNKESDSSPESASLDDELLAYVKPGEYTGVIEPGTTAGQLLNQWMPHTEVAQIVDACKKVYGLHNLRAGQPYFVVVGEGSGFQRLEYDIDKDQRLVVTKDGNNYTAKIDEIVYEVVLKKVEGTIDSSLFQAMDNAGENPALAVRLANIFAWEINFIRSIQPGDSFRLLVEKRYLNGEFKGYGTMPMAVFVNEGRTHDAFLFQDSKGNRAYFNKDGDSLKSAFLKAPLSYTRISSRFTPKRLHPILKTWRAHPAVDYAAPSGTPVKAIGNGQITFAGFGKGAGNYIALKHRDGYESMYLHLKGFAKGIKKGVHVNQGQVIGYVGSTGYSTGPHLDFRVKRNGKYMNPESLPSPKSDPVSKTELAQFRKNRDIWRAYMDGIKPPEEYAKDVAEALPPEKPKKVGG